MEKQQNNVVSSTPYDDAYRTLVTDCPELMIPVVNEMFQKHHGIGEKVTLFQNELYFTLPNSDQKERITDSNIAIGDDRYHLECQSTMDGTMILRVFEYDSQMALKDSDCTQEELTVHFPSTGLIYLRHTSNTPESLKMTIVVPGDSCSYEIPILKVKDYTLEEIFEKRLFFLLPFHLFAYEKDFEKYDTDVRKLGELSEHYTFLMRKLEVCVTQGLISTYAKSAIIAMMKKVMQALAKKHERITEGLGDVMGGKILDYEAKDILNRGREEGREEGRAQQRAETEKERQRAEKAEAELERLREELARLKK